MPARALRRAKADPAAAIPRPRYDPALPITAHREAIVEAIGRHRVIVVAGETGCGKTTQLPKFCLEAGRGLNGMIGCTQPRRIAARAVAERVAEELELPVGGLVGYQVRFTDRTAPATRIKFMTDGILLAETQGDRLLKAYDTLILDEAHERSLNIDFLLGFLQRLLEKRRDLKLIITSATIDTRRFARHFNEAPVIEVSGRGYPVEVRYRPLGEQGEGLNQAIAGALDELDRQKPGGDTLVFLSGEREIREASAYLRKQRAGEREILPLYGRLSAKAQHRVFHPGNQRRVVLATNVAETSLTVPRIRFVIDAGTARISRYSPRSKIQRLPIEPISQASAEQRAGRCGRLGPGVCIRLYSDEDFEGRPRYTEPEILRTNLASVILRMSALKLGAVEDFPFLDQPTPQQVNDGYQLLIELGALDSERQLTPLGRDLARLPLDPQLGRMILAAPDWGCLEGVLVIAGALSIQDPRERPLDAQAQADEAHAAFADARSDFMGLLKLWKTFQSQRERLGSNPLKRWCAENFLSHRRMREWREVHHQLKILARELGLPKSGQGDYESLHRALLSGLIGHVGRLDEDKHYEGPRQRRFMLHPSSALFAKPPQWVVGAELVETSRVFARGNAWVKPEWVEQAALTLLKRHYYEPHYDLRSARVYAFEQVSLFGLTLVEKRRVHFGPIKPAQARKLFIRHALVRFEYQTDAPFMEHNQSLVAEIKALEHKQRRHDVLAHEDTLMRFFDARIPAGIYTGKAFERWRRDAEAEKLRVLFLDRDDLMRHQAVDVSAERYPELLSLGGTDYLLYYHFEPGSAMDGVTLQVPLHKLNDLDQQRLDWLVPGLIREKLETLLKGLPKGLRRHFVPVPDFVQALLEAMPYAQGGLHQRMALELRRMSGVEVHAETLSGIELPAHLRFNIQVLDDAGETVEQGRDVSALQTQLGSAGRRAFDRRAGSRWRRDGIRAWDFGDLPERVALGDSVVGFPALVDQGRAVGLRLFQTEAESNEAMGAGLVRLLMLALPDKLKYLKRNSPVTATMCMHYASLDSCTALKEDFIQAVFYDLTGLDATVIRDEQAFEALVQRERQALLPRAEHVSVLLKDVLKAYYEVSRRLDEAVLQAWPEAIKDLAAQLAWLVWPGFVRECAMDRLQHYPRYLTATNLRLDGLHRDPKADLRKQQQIAPYWDAYQALVEQHGWPGPEELEHLRWLIEEYRVSVFAQTLGTAEPASPRRLDQAVKAASFE